jgi:KaiC/GvpD/RAD55 family RecA-like ATPase
MKEEFEDAKGVIRIRKLKKDRQRNGNVQKKKDKRTNNDLKKHTHKTKDRVTRTQLKTGDFFQNYMYHSLLVSTNV